MLEDLGLRKDDERVYRVLVEVRGLDTQALSEAASLSLERTRRACRRLVDLRLVRRVRVPGRRSWRIEAVDPQTGLQSLILARDTRLRQAQTAARELGDAFRRATTATTRDELMEVLVGPDEITSRIGLTERAAREVRVIERPPYHADSDRNDPEEFALLDRGGRARAIYDRTALDYPGRVSVIREAAAAGEESRVMANAPAKIIIIDDSVAMMPLHAGHGLSPAFIVINPSALLDALVGMFELCWRLALPIGMVDGAGVADAGEGSSEEQLLALMDMGLADSAIARELGVSERTVRRRLHDLLVARDLKTRYQLGLRRGLGEQGPERT